MVGLIYDDSVTAALHQSAAQVQKDHHKANNPSKAPMMHHRHPLGFRAGFSSSGRAAKAVQMSVPAAT
jgi:hypothetical protein